MTLSRILRVCLLSSIACANLSIAANAPVIHYLKPSTAAKRQEKSAASTAPADGLMSDAETATADKPDVLAHAYLQQHAKELAIDIAPEQLKLQSQKQSLLGQHLLFKPVVKDLLVTNRELVISVDQQGEVHKVFDNLRGLNSSTLKSANKAVLTAVPKISRTSAERIAWLHLASTGKMLREPKTKMVFYATNDDTPKLKLSYEIEIGVSEPLGFWRFYVDAKSGAVLEASNTAPPRKRAAAQSTSGKPHSLSQALQEYKMRDKLITAKEVQPKPATWTDGQALVFDPNPRTTLGDLNINDKSSAASFEGAYQTKTLRDISLIDGQYQLTGPWVKITDFDYPYQEPSTSDTGYWHAKRGDNAFNDATTYFHIDQSQRYLQSLGFTGAHGIQYGQIEVDTDGAWGNDNSYFLPSENRLSFGHGGVDDSEDAEVILHEYGHAIQHSINSEWRGGDTGAMGEGFGDYWAASYRYMTPMGKIVFPNWVFVWDGHNDYWNGRVLDATALYYNPNKHYRAHERLGHTGYSTDELWSTPLFQSFVSLLKLGVPKSEIDRSILEAHFGLGSDITMRQMADAIVRTAKTLYPEGPHAAVFMEKFKAQKILAEDYVL